MAVEGDEGTGYIKNVCDPSLEKAKVIRLRISNKIICYELGELFSLVQEQESKGAVVREPKFLVELSSSQIARIKTEYSKELVKIQKMPQKELLTQLAYALVSEMPTVELLPQLQKEIETKGEETTVREMVETLLKYCIVDDEPIREGRRINAHCKFPGTLKWENGKLIVASTAKKS